MDQPIKLLDIFGLRPLGPALRSCWKAIVGNAHLPPTRFGLSSLRIFKPWISFPTWLGFCRRDRLTPIYNFVNRKPPPRGAAYSVKVTDCQDFQGGRWTYDSHVGTDFAVPVGTAVTAAAPGVIRQVRNDMNRGGLKICIDHGKGLFTTSNHLAQALVKCGQRVARGEVIGRSGMSGVDGVLFFPWLAPHLHFNVFLNGDAIDPFAAEGESSLWRSHNKPVPHQGKNDEDFEPSEWSEEGINSALDVCRDPELKAKVSAMKSLEDRGSELLLGYSFSSPLFETYPRLYAEQHKPEAALDLPFRAQDFSGAHLPPV